MGIPSLKKSLVTLRLLDMQFSKSPRGNLSLTKQWGTMKRYSPSRCRNGNHRRDFPINSSSAWRGEGERQKVMRNVRNKAGNLKDSKKRASLAEDVLAEK